MTANGWEAVVGLGVLALVLVAARRLSRRQDPTDPRRTADYLPPPVVKFTGYDQEAPVRAAARRRAAHAHRAAARAIEDGIDTGAAS